MIKLSFSRWFIALVVCSTMHITNTQISHGIDVPLLTQGLQRKTEGIITIASSGAQLDEDELNHLCNYVSLSRPAQRTPFITALNKNKGNKTALVQKLTISTKNILDTELLLGLSLLSYRHLLNKKIGTISLYDIYQLQQNLQNYSNQVLKKQFEEKISELISNVNLHGAVNNGRRIPITPPVPED